MKKYINIIGISIIAILLITVMIQCNKNRKLVFVEKTITKTDTIKGDSIPVIIQVPKPYIVFKDTGSIHETIVDTVAILREYLTKNIYKRVLKDDSSAYVAIIDTVFKNELQSGVFEFQNRKITSIITTNTTTISQLDLSSWHIYLGMLAGYGIKDKAGFSPIIGYQDKKNKIFTYSYDILRNYHQAGILFQFK